MLKSETVREGSNENGERRKEKREAGQRRKARRGAQGGTGSATAFGEGTATAARTVRQRSSAGAGQGIGPEESDGGSAAQQDCRQHGRGRGDAECEAYGPGRERTRPDYRTKAGGDAGEEIDRGLQGSRRHADWRHGHAAWRPHVRIFRSPGEYRASACARFSRSFDEVVRRPRQLHARPARSVDLSGDRLRQSG